MSKLYTGTGDDGFTRRLGEGRLPKHHPVTEAIGTVDEASAAIGLARAASQADETGRLLLEIQRDLYNLMAEVAATHNTAAQFRVIDEDRVSWLEKQTDQISGLIHLPNEFIVPGDTFSGASMSIARTIVRRAERRIAQLLIEEEIQNLQLLRYLNRLSSLCFALEILENQKSGKSDVTLAKMKKK
ncbi:MAG: cob(I)yrinic acid a,c-diamide adenosyltransferase [Anaerolineales bacterium]|nr:cob(I)yrinic acid a,c-diamide adenosyltransferase [Anaerolineales bacterium]